MKKTDAKERGIELLIKALEDRVDYISLEFTGIDGRVKSFEIPTPILKDHLKGEWFGFDGSSIEGFARIFESDKFLWPDNETYRVFPWKFGKAQKKVARVICDVYQPNGNPLPMDPRYLLKSLLERLKKKKRWIYNVGSEPEFFLRYPNGDPHDRASYFDFWADEGTDVRIDIMDAMVKMGLLPEMSHHEVSHSQHEIDFRFGDALATADNIMTFKTIAKKVAQEHGLVATFMPKPIAEMNGSGMHTHQSLSSLNGKNLFYSKNDPYRLSKLARGFIAGQMLHAQALTAVVAPTVNSYRRLVPGFEAPVNVSWARSNRSAFIRVPEYPPNQTQATRAEFRPPDTSSNPYLVYTALLVAGIHGVLTEAEKQLPEPIEEDIFDLSVADRKLRKVASLPGSLREALIALKKDEVVRRSLGKVYRVFMQMKIAEWNSFIKEVKRSDRRSGRVTDWELERYL